MCAENHVAAPSNQEAISSDLLVTEICHAAFDRGIIGIWPDYVVEVREDVLKEVDGPMLKYGLQALHTTELLLPSRILDWPSKDALERRYESFMR